MSKPATQVIAVAVIIHEDRVVVGIRQAHQSLAGKSEFPGGKVEPGETIEQALSRETLEETGLQIVPVQSLLTEHHTYEHARVSLHFWKCSLATPAEVERPIENPFQWKPINSLKEDQFPEGNRALLELLLSEFAT